ncbi:MAG: RNA methyltransferase, partial [Deltaproteobacteria bacterium]|nr:RNA methyltransferase [Deltaproteobacteria bacterium]
SQGAVFYSDVVRVPNIARAIEDLKDMGIWVVGLSSEAEDDIYSFKFDIPVAIVVGSEGKGLRRLTQERCEKILSIPMKGNINSLNASVSFAISAYEIFRQRYFIK